MMTAVSAGAEFELSAAQARGAALAAQGSAGRGRTGGWTPGTCGGRSTTSACCSWTRSTSSAAPITCRSSRGSAPIRGRPWTGWPGTRTAPPKPRRGPGAPGPVRVLGARGLAAAGRAAAAAALADGAGGRRWPGKAWRGSRRSSRELLEFVLDVVRERGPIRAADLAAKGRRRGAAGDVELERREDRARVPVLRRPGLRGAAGQLRAALRPARAGPAAAGPRGADARRRTRRSGSCS